MRKIASWSVAFITSAVSLAAMCAFDLLLGVIGYYMKKVPFLSDIGEFCGEMIGELLGFGITTLAALGIAGGIWKVGLTIIKKIEKKDLDYSDPPLGFTNGLFILLFLGTLIFLGVQFFMVVGGFVMTYTADLQGLAKILMFFAALKDAYFGVCAAHFIISMICADSLSLMLIHVIFSH